MKPSLWLGGLLGAGLLAAAVHANPGYPVVRYAPNTFGQGYYLQNEHGAWYGPCYSLMPLGQPFNGLLPPMECKKRTPTPPTLAGPPGPPGQGPYPAYAPYASSYLPGPLEMPAYNPAFRHGPGVVPGYPSNYGFKPGGLVPNYPHPYGGPGLPPYVPPAYMYRPGAQPGLGQLPYQHPVAPPAMAPAKEEKTEAIQPVQSVQNFGAQAGPRPQVFQPIPGYQPNYYPGGMRGYPASAPNGQNGDANNNGGAIAVDPCAPPPPPIPIFSTHPFARSPRDFFMLD